MRDVRASRQDRVVGLSVATLAWLAHVAFLLFLIGGGYLAWWWPWVLVAHLGTAAWGVYIVATRHPCPLTALENWGRDRAGRPPLAERGFIPHYVEGHLYPVAWARSVERVVGVVVLASWVGAVVALW